MMRWTRHSHSSYCLEACRLTSDILVKSSAPLIFHNNVNHYAQCSTLSSFYDDLNTLPATIKHDNYNFLSGFTSFSLCLFSSINRFCHSHVLTHPVTINLHQYRQLHNTHKACQGRPAVRASSKTVKKKTENISSKVKKKPVASNKEIKLESDDVVKGDNNTDGETTVDNNDTSYYPTALFPPIPSVTPLTLSGSTFIGSDASALGLAFKTPRCGSPIWLTADEVHMLHCGVKSDATWVGLPSSARPGGLDGLQCFVSSAVVPTQEVTSTNSEKLLLPITHKKEMDNRQAQSSSQTELSLVPHLHPTIFVVNAVDTFYPHLFYSGMCHEHRILIGFDGCPLGHIPLSSGTIAGTPAQPPTSSTFSYQATGQRQDSSQTEENIPSLSLEKNKSEQSQDLLHYNATQSALSKAVSPAALVAASASAVTLQKHSVGYASTAFQIKGNINCNGDMTVAAACAHLQQQIGFTSPYWIPTWFAKHCLGLEVLPGANLVACITAAKGQVAGASNSIVSNEGLFSLPGVGCDEMISDISLPKSSCYPPYSCPSVERHLVSFGTGTKYNNSVCSLPNTDTIFLVNAEQTSDASCVNSDTCFPYFPTVIGVSFFRHPTAQSTATCPLESTIVHRIPLLLSLSHRKILSQVPGQTLPIFIDRRVIDILGLTLKPNAEGVCIDEFYQDLRRTGSLSPIWGIDGTNTCRGKELSTCDNEARDINQQKTTISDKDNNWEKVDNNNSAFSSTAVLVNIAHIKEDTFIHFLATYHPSKIQGHPLSGVPFLTAFPSPTQYSSDNGIYNCTVPDDETYEYEAPSLLTTPPPLDSKHDMRNIEASTIVPTVTFDYSLQFALIAWQQQYRMNAWLTMNQIEMLQLKLCTPRHQDNVTTHTFPSVQVEYYNDRLKKKVYSTFVNAEEIEGFMMPVSSEASNVTCISSSSTVPDFSMLAWIQTSLKEANNFYRGKKAYYESRAGGHSNTSHSTYNYKQSRNQHQVNHQHQQQYLQHKSQVGFHQVSNPPLSAFFQDSSTHTDTYRQEELDSKVTHSMPYFQSPQPQSASPSYNTISPVIMPTTMDQYKAIMPPHPSSGNRW